MKLDLSKKECLIILGALSNDMCNLERMVFYGGDVGSRSEILHEYVSNVHSKIFHALICEADVEANCQDAAAALPKCTASDLKQREAGDEVSLDHPDHLKQEVFNG